MTLTILRALVLASMVAATAGCAIIYEGKYDFDEGWRTGRIVRVGKVADMSDIRYAQCKEGLESRVPSSQDVALVAYQNSRGFQRRIVSPMPTDSTLRTGDTVYVHVRQCATSLVPRATSTGEAKR